MYVYICILNPHVQLKIEADHFFFIKRAWNQLTPFSSSCIVCRQTWTPDWLFKPNIYVSIWSWKSKGALISVLSLYLQAEYTTRDPFYTIETQIILGITAAQNHMGLYLRQSVTLPQAFCVLSLLLPYDPIVMLFQREQPYSWDSSFSVTPGGLHYCRKGFIQGQGIQPDNL